MSDPRKNLEFGIEELAQKLAAATGDAIEDAIALGYQDSSSEELLINEFTRIIENFIYESD